MLSMLIDYLYPSDLYCICCGKIIDESRTYRLCDDCMKNIKWNNGRTCKKCGKRLADNNPSDICFNCKEHQHEFNRGFSCVEYGTHERQIIMGYKYGDKLQIGETIGEMLADCMRAELGDELDDAYGLLVPVPLTTERERTRGFNQASEIAAHFAKHIEKGISPSLVLRKVRPQYTELGSQEPSPMKRLSPEQRRESIKGCFVIKPGCEYKIKNQNCLIIDDIYTTGATVDELAKTLYDAGANKVDFATFASGSDVIKS